MTAELKKQQGAFYRYLFKINTKDELQTFYEFIREQRPVEKIDRSISFIVLGVFENHTQFVNKTKQLVDFFEAHPTLNLDYDLYGNYRYSLWSYFFDKNIFNRMERINIYKYADAISENISYLSLNHKDIVDKIIKFLREQFPENKTEKNIVENLKSLKHLHELYLFLSYLNEIIKREELEENSLLYNIRIRIRIIYNKNIENWDNCTKLQYMKECTDDIIDWYKELEPQLCQEINNFFVDE